MSYEKTDNLLDLALWMQSSREGVTLNDIVERFGVSRRTAERMRDMIVNHFIQAEEVDGDDRKKRWRIPQGALKDMFLFSADELTTLSLAEESLRKVHLDVQADVLNKVLQKVKASMKQDLFRKIEPDTEALLEAQGFAHRPGPKLKINPEFLSIIKEAILACKKIQIKYTNTSGKSSTQIVAPYGFLYGNKHYLVAYSDFAKDYRYYALHKLMDVVILNEYFEKDKNFTLADFTKDCFGVFKEKPHNIEWLFDKEVAEDAAKYEFHPSQKMIKNPDGTLTVKFRAGGLQEMDWHLYTWGNHVKVIKPKKK